MGEGLREVSEAAVLNANYIKASLKTTMKFHMSNIVNMNSY